MFILHPTRLSTKRTPSGQNGGQRTFNRSGEHAAVARGTVYKRESWMHTCPLCNGTNTRQSRSQPARFDEKHDKAGQIVIYFRFLGRTCKTCKADYWVRQSRIGSTDDWDGDTYVDEEEYLTASPNYSKTFVGVFAGDYTKRISRGPSIRESERERLRQYSPN